MEFTYSALILTLVSLTQGAYVPVPTATPTYSYPSAVPAVASQSQSVIRSLDGNSVYSTYSKAVDTPHSSVRKYDSRVNNDAVVYAHVPAVSYAAPVYHKPTYVSSPYYHYPSPSYYPAHPTYPSYSSYSAPVYSAPAPAAVYHPTVYHSPSYYQSVKAAPAVHAPAAHYSDAASVSHLSFEGLGAHYEW